MGTRDDVQQGIDGHDDAVAFLNCLQRFVPAPDALHEHLQVLINRGEAERLRAFCRRLQKSLGA